MDQNLKNLKPSSRKGKGINSWSSLNSPRWSSVSLRSSPHQQSMEMSNSQIDKKSSIPSMKIKSNWYYLVVALPIMVLKLLVLMWLFISMLLGILLYVIKERIEYIAQGKPHPRGADGSVFTARVIWSTPNKSVEAD